MAATLQAGFAVLLYCSMHLLEQYKSVKLRMHGTEHCKIKKWNPFSEASNRDPPVQIYLDIFRLNRATRAVVFMQTQNRVDKSACFFYAFS
jgi:hypothetical protein